MKIHYPIISGGNPVRSCRNIHRNIKAFDKVLAKKGKPGLLFITRKERFSCLLYVHFQFLCNLVRLNHTNRVVLDTSVEHDLVSGSDPTGFCNAVPDLDRTGFPTKIPGKL